MRVVEVAADTHNSKKKKVQLARVCVGALVTCLISKPVWRCAEKNLRTTLAIEHSSALLPNLLQRANNTAHVRAGGRADDDITRQDLNVLLLDFSRKNPPPPLLRPSKVKKSSQSLKKSDPPQPVGTSSRDQHLRVHCGSGRLLRWI